MKKQTRNNKFAFGKATVTELNTNELQEVNGGTLSISNISYILSDFTRQLTIRPGEDMSSQQN